MKYENMQRPKIRTVRLTAVFFISFCGIVFAQDFFESKNPDEPKKSSEEVKQAGPEKRSEPIEAVKETQESNPQGSTPLTAEEVQRSFEKAMKAVDAGRLEKEKQMEELLRKRLRVAVEDWVNAVKNKLAIDLNKIMNQEWERVNEFGPYIHYNYYLRDYEIMENGTDIKKTDSLTAPYNAYLNVTEKLYVEKYTTPDISYIEDFLYTVTYLIKVNFEYRNDRFNMVNDEYGQPSLEKGWPAHIRGKLRDKVLAR